MKSQFQKLKPKFSQKLTVYKNSLCKKYGCNFKKLNYKSKGDVVEMASNKHVVPEAKQAMNRFKMEAASEVGVNLKEGYNGDLTSRQAGSIGGQMVNNICPERNMKFERNYRWLDGHLKSIGYKYNIVV